MKKMSLTVKTILALAAGIALSYPALAAAPNEIAYQGKLTDNGGSPLADGSYSITFSVYGSASGGSPIESVNQSVSTVNGVFSTVVLFTANHFSGGTSRYLQLQRVGAPSPFLPRQKLVAAPYALAVAAGAVGLTEINQSDLDSRYLNAANLTGSVADARLSSNVTLQGNTVNAANGLVILNGSNEASIGGGLSLGGGTVLKKILSVTGPTDFGSLSSGATSTDTITVTGANPGDVVLIGAPSNTDFNKLMLYGSVTSVNTVTVRCFNPTSSTVNTISGTVRVSVLQY
ncbi:MAG: hypothetical protein IPP35_00555 [Elusimicrobia bacterium]|nr:hypothetical protein [Elusimicrobiota bacterium]